MQTIILCISGHDPSGGAGIQADIETINQLGGHAASLISCLTLQDSHGLQECRPVEADWLRRQAELLLADFPIAAVKVGALGSLAVAQATTAIIQQLRSTQPDLPVVIDPVLSAGGGGALADNSVLEHLISQLLPMASLATPNLSELERLTTISDNPDTAAASLLQQGCDALLLTGTDSPASLADNITHWLYAAPNKAQAFNCQRLPGDYHGSGCTLAAALALYLAQGLDRIAATTAALHYCWQSLAQGQPLGRGQAFPRRGPLS